MKQNAIFDKVAVNVAPVAVSAPIFVSLYFRLKMNFLAHIFLSGDNELVKIGNFMADGIRGKDYRHFHPDIQRGIMLHRAIDTFTDAHPVFRKSTKRLHVRYHHYAGVIVDVFYDHFLAKNWNRFMPGSLRAYVNLFYKSLDRHFDLLTPKTQQIYPIMLEHNWLLSYATVDGMKSILTQMDRRTGNISNMRFAVEDLTFWYKHFEYEFHIFFDEIRKFAQEKLEALEEQEFEYIPQEN